MPDPFCAGSRECYLDILRRGSAKEEGLERKCLIPALDVLPPAKETWNRAAKSADFPGKKRLHWPALAVLGGVKGGLGRDPQRRVDRRMQVTIDKDPARLKSFAWLLFNLDEFTYVR
jgi:hypothetical protein